MVPSMQGTVISCKKSSNEPRALPPQKATQILTLNPSLPLSGLNQPLVNHQQSAKQDISWIFKVNICWNYPLDVMDLPIPPIPRFEQCVYIKLFSISAPHQHSILLPLPHTAIIIPKVLQPGKKLYDGHGVARPSAFIAGGSPRFVPDLEAVMSDHGGPGSWLWKKLPKKPTQGLARPPGGAAALLAASGLGGHIESLAESKKRAAEAKEQERKREAKKKRLLDLREEFLAESRLGPGGGSKAGQHRLSGTKKQTANSSQRGAGGSPSPVTRARGGKKDGGLVMVGVVDGKIQMMRDGEVVAVAGSSRPKVTAAAPVASDRVKKKRSFMPLPALLGGKGGRAKAVSVPAAVATGQPLATSGGMFSKQGGGDMAMEREKALAAYRFLRAQQQKKSQLQRAR
jgi:hypothetical protein